MTVRTVPTGGTVSPISISFRSADPSPPALPATLAAAQLPPAGTSQAVAALMDRLSACYALTLSQRVNAPSDTGSVTGGPADVIAAVCRTLFVNDDPASYLSGGLRVGRDASNAGAFASLYRSAATGVKFDRGQLEFYRDNADLVLSYRTVDATSGSATRPSSRAMEAARSS